MSKTPLLLVGFLQLLVSPYASTASWAATPTMEAVQPTTRFEASTIVSVNWEGIPPTADPHSDWVSVWWVPFKVACMHARTRTHARTHAHAHTHNFQATYVEFRNVSGASSSGTADFNLFNARHAYTFRYYRNDTMLVESNPVFPEGAFPNQVRLSLVGNQVDAIRVAWTSNRTDPNGNTVLRYGLDPNHLDMEVAATSSSYTHAELQARVNPEGPSIPTMTAPFPNIGARALRCDYNCYNVQRPSLYTSRKLKGERKK